MEYFIVQGLGYDGMIIFKYKSLEDANRKYEEEQLEIKEWIRKYGEDSANKGLALIEGNIVKSEDIEF